GHDGLIDRRRHAAGERPGADERLGEGRRDDEITETQGREEDLAEGTEVDDALVRVETLDGRNRSRGVAVFAVVVVLEYPGGGTVAGIFEPDVVAGIEEDARGDLQAMLQTVGDDDLRRLAGDAARRTDVAGHGLAQAHQAGRVAVGERFEHARSRPRPLLRDE